MIDFAAARRMMVDGQVRTSDVSDLRIIAAMLELPRERFVPDSKAALAYLDADVPVTEAQGGKPARRGKVDHSQDPTRVCGVSLAASGGKRHGGEHATPTPPRERHPERLPAGNRSCIAALAKRGADGYFRSDIGAPQGPRGGVVTQRSAKPCTPVQFRAWPPHQSASQGTRCGAKAGVATVDDRHAYRR